MDKESKILLYALAFLIGVSVFLVYYRSFISQTYDIIRSEPAGAGTTTEEAASN